MIETTCVDCGCKVIAQRKTRKYCDDCKTIRKNKLNSEYDSKTRPQRFCLRCDSNITGTTQKKYCVPCSKVVKQEQTDAHNQKMLANNKANKLTTFKCVDCNGTFPIKTRKVQRCAACTTEHIKKRARERYLERKKADVHSFINVIKTIDISKQHKPRKLCQECHQVEVLGLKKLCDKCSEIRRKKVAKKYKDKVRKHKKPKILTCVDCKCSFTSPGNALRCEDCKIIHTKKYFKEYYLNNRRPRILAKIKFINCEKCDKIIKKKNHSHKFCTKCGN